MKLEEHEGKTKKRPELMAQPNGIHPGRYNETAHKEIFSMFENIKNMASALGQAKDLQTKMEQLQEELGRKTVEADAGAGAVRVVANGRLEIVSVRLDPTLIPTIAGSGDDADQQMIEDLITAATNAALHKARQLIGQEMSQLTGGVDIAGLMG